VDIIGLSGLITPSLDEMVHVAREMERKGLTLPLLIGGATTSKAHTAVKIAPNFNQPVVHVLDASRAVPVASNLISAEHKPKFVAQIRDEYDRVRATHGSQTVKLLSLEAARANAPKLKFDDLPKPEFLGARPIDVSLAELVPFIDWSPSFTPGNCAAFIPKSSSTKNTAKRPANFSPTRRNYSTKSSAKS